MSSTDALYARKLAARGVVQASVDDTPVILRLRYVGTGAVTSVTMTTNTALVLISTGTGETTLTCTFGSGVTLSTVGALADYINASGYWEAKVLDALRSDATTGSQFLENTTVTAGTDANGVVGYDLHADTSVNKCTTTTLSLGRNWNYPSKIKQMHRVNLYEIDYNENIGGAIAQGVVVYFRLNAGNGLTESLQFARSAANSAATTINFAGGLGYITAPDGAEIIVRVLTTGTQTDATTNYVQAVGTLE